MFSRIIIYILEKNFQWLLENKDRSFFFVSNAVFSFVDVKKELLKKKKTKRSQRISYQCFHSFIFMNVSIEIILTFCLSIEKKIDEEGN